MGSRGPTKKTREEQEARGNPGKRKLVDAPAEQIVDPTLPVKPGGMTTEEHDIWDRLIPRLVALNLADQIDSDDLADYCFYRAKADLYKAILRHTKPVKNSNNTTTQLPEHKLLADARKQIAAIGASFGLSARARKGMNITLRRSKTAGTTGGSSPKAIKYRFDK